MEPKTRISSALRVIVGATLGAARWPAWAQAPVTPPGLPVPIPSDGSGSTQAGLMIGLILAVIGLIVVLVKVSDVRRKRRAEAVAIEGQIGDALLRDPALARIPVVVEVRVPLRRGLAKTMEVRGTVPTQDVRYSVLRLVEREMAGSRPPYQVEDRLIVLPNASTHAA